MNEDSDGVRDKSVEIKNDGQSKGEENGGGKPTPNLTENASRNSKLVENGPTKLSSAYESKAADKTKSDRYGSYDKRYDYRDRGYKNANGMKGGPSGRGRREDDRRSSPSKPYRGRQELKSSYRRDDRRESDSKRPYDSSKSYSDEPRLTKLIKKLQRETERDRRLYVVKQILDFLPTPDGKKALLRNGDEHLDSLKDFFFERGYKDVKSEVVKCIGYIGAVLNHDPQRYFNWMFSQLSAVEEDEIRIYFLQALKETIRQIDRQLIANSVEDVLNTLQSHLECADTPELLVAVVDVILEVTRGFPEVFQYYFRDTVDILVGWHIDSSQRDRVIEVTSEALISFQQFWVQDQEFTRELLGQFLEDMEAYAEDLRVLVKDQPGSLEPCPEEILKIGSLLKVFTTVMKSLGTEFDPNQSEELSFPYLLEMFEKTVRTIDSAVKCSFSEYIIITGDECFEVILVLLRGAVQDCRDVLLTYVTTVTFPAHPVSNRYICAALNLVCKTVEVCGVQLPVSWLTSVLKTGSLLRSSKLLHDSQVLKALIRVYKRLLSLRSIPLLEETYRHLLGDIEVAFNMLLGTSGDEGLVRLVTSNPFEGKTYSRMEAETVCVFSLCALGEIGNTKNNLIGMWALSPSLFDLYSERLDVVRSSISVQYPALQYAILQALYSHCNTHGNFISTSSLLTQTSPMEGSLMANVSPSTSSNFTRLLKVLADLLRHPNTSFDSKLLSVRWVTELVSSLRSSPQVYTTRQFLTLVQALYIMGYDSEEEVASSVQICLTNLFQNPRTYPTYIVKGCVKLCMYRLNEGSETLRDNYFSLLCLLPLNVTASKNNGLYLLEEVTQLAYSEHAVGLESLWQVCRQYTTRVPLGSFHSHNFRQVMAYLLHNQKNKVVGSQAWLDSMFQAAQRPSSKPDWKSADMLVMQNYVSQSVTVQWFWGTWEAAQFCVLTRLKTPLGKPHETFTSIEAVLKSLANQVQVHSQEDEDNDRKKGKVSSGEGELQRVKLLLQFMEQLEKHLYNAFEGTAGAMPSLPKAVRTFFRTNKNTCLEWLSRVRMYVIVLAMHAGMYATVVRQASVVLRDLKDTDNTQGSEVEVMVQYLVQALCKLGEADAVQGVYSWCREALGRKFMWVKAAVEKASGRYESAAKEFQSVIKVTLQQVLDSKEEAGKENEVPTPSRITGILSKPSSLFNSTLPTGIHFKLNMFVNEVLDCYVQLNDWEAALTWQQAYTEMRETSILNTPPPTYNIDTNVIKALSLFDQGEVGSVSDLLELVPEPTGSGHWGVAERENLVLNRLLRAAAITHQHANNNHKSEIVGQLSEVVEICEGLLKVQCSDWPILASPDTLALLTIAATLQDHVDNKSVCLLPLSDRFHMDESDHRLSTFLQALRLVQLQHHISNGTPDLLEQLHRLQLSVASLARKQSNSGLAQRILNTQATSFLEGQGDIKVGFDLDSLKVNMKQLLGVEGYSQVKSLRLQREAAKLLHCAGDHRDAVDLLSSSVVGYVQCGVRSSTCSDLTARSLLTLVKWLQVDHKLLSSLASSVGQGDGLNTLAVNVQHLLDLEEKQASSNMRLIINKDSADLKIGDNPILTDTDRIVGRLLHLSTVQSESLPKGWYAFAGWCYKWGRKAVDNASHGSVQLLSEEKTQILSLLPEDISEGERDAVVTILGRVHSSLTSEEDISDQDQSQYDDGTETRRQLLVSCEALCDSGDALEALLGVWRGVVHRIYHYYQLAASSYFKFLKLNGENDPLKEENTEDCNVISTLRVLRLLVKHAWELRTVLEDGLAETPTTPWKGIIPQLFSRLSHPEAYVRQSISDLLCRVAEDAPHLIVYPAVVGSYTTKMEAKTETGLLTNYLAVEGVGEGEMEGDVVPLQEEEGDTDPEADSMLHSCIVSMLNTLAVKSPQMIGDVKQLIEELRRITLLWDELWLGTLNQQHQDVERRISQLEAEIKRVNNNSALGNDERAAIIREKHKTVLKPTVFMMERVSEITSQPPATPHEVWFQEAYGQLIANALNKLKNPPNPSHPRASWHPFKQIHVSLQQRAQKRVSLILKMEEISPKLHALRNTVIAMPGLGAAGQIVTIESVSSAVQILPTKTKPKKLVFKGSDGKRYPYLFKGLEDLHLDERIMQFLNIVNNMFAAADKGSHELYRARHYSVTPLGPRSGLIQWVDGVTAMFALYKRWQQREALIQMMKQQAAGATNQQQTAGGASANQQQPNIPRPSEVYYNKLTPLLKEKGIKDLESRKDWPLSVQCKVLQDLMAETPRDLLSRELWCTSTGPNEWWYVTQTFARSTAVMSMIGYIIGLGDRHLDNVLVDLSTGEVVHIDYNVCFEKGKSLRVPERVPFRLTQNVESALGVTGIEGTFRLASEHVMKTLRKGRETLLTLLEAFVYDPLVDWTTGNEGGYTGAFYGGGGMGGGGGDSRQGRVDMEREITASMFSIRVAEMRVNWLQNRDELLAVLPRAQGHLDNRAARIAEYTQLMVEEQHLQELRQLIQEAQANPASPLLSLARRYGEYEVIKRNRDSVNALIQEKIGECLSWHNMHKHVMTKVVGAAFQQMCVDIAASLNLGTPSFNTAKDFLQSAGQGSVIQQCELVESELTANLTVQRDNLRLMIDVLHRYGTIVSQFGQSFPDNTRTSHYLNWLRELVVDFSESKCEDIIRQCGDTFGDSRMTPARVQVVRATDLRLQTIIQDTNTRLLKLLDRRRQEKADIRMLEMNVKECRSAIDIFIQECGDAGVKSLSAVVLTVLCTLNKRNLQMEAAATGAGDRLMDLTSRDGDWFLEELCSMSGNVTQFLDMVSLYQPQPDDSQLGVMYRGMQATNHVYNALQDLNVNFRTIILPEALKIIQSQESSVFLILSRLEAILREPGGPSLDTVIQQLEVLHRNAVMGIKNENTELLSRVTRIRAVFKDLLETGVTGVQDLTPGQMLLMGFNGLFTRLEEEFSSLLESVDSLQVPSMWRKVDVVKEAKSLQLSSFTTNTRSLLSSLFFIRRLQVMQEFFHTCTQFAAAIQGLEGGACADDEQFTRPVKRFVADFVRKQIIGFPTQILGYILCSTMESMGLDVTAEVELKDVGAESKAPLEELCKKAVDQALRLALFQQVHLSQASTLTTSQDATWRRHDLTRRLDCNLEILKSSLQRARLHITRLHWIHEDVFMREGVLPNTMVMANRAAMMLEIKRVMQAVVSEEQQLGQCQAQYATLESSITQRLKWAAGANPSLNLVLQQFEDASHIRKQLAEEEAKNSQEVISLCQGILHMEALRTRTPEALTSETNFLLLMNKCLESCHQTSQSNSSVGHLEIMLMQMKPLSDGEQTDGAWLVGAHKEVTQRLKEADKKMLALKNSIDDARDGIQAEVDTIKSVIQTHHKLMSDIRTILKSLAKQEETEQGEQVIAGGIRDYLNMHKKFSENLVLGLKLMVSEEFTADSMAETRQLLASLAEQIPLIYDELVSLAPPLPSSGEDQRSGSPLSFATAVKKSASGTEEAGLRRSSTMHPAQTNTPPSNSPQTNVGKPAVSTPAKKSEKVARDPKTGKAIQERNSYAVGVWRRVKMKLDGRDPDQNKRLSVQEQVEYVINDATSLDNLAVLYEGWTPWV